MNRMECLRSFCNEICGGGGGGGDRQEKVKDRFIVRNLTLFNRNCILFNRNAFFI